MGLLLGGVSLKKHKEEAIEIDCTLIFLKFLMYFPGPFVYKVAQWFALSKIMFLID